jgi:hypothetical protein
MLQGEFKPNCALGNESARWMIELYWLLWGS